MPTRQSHDKTTAWYFIVVCDEKSTLNSPYFGPSDPVFQKEETFVTFPNFKVSKVHLKRVFNSCELVRRTERVPVTTPALLSLCLCMQAHSFVLT